MDYDCVPRYEKLDRAVNEVIKRIYLLPSHHLEQQRWEPSIFSTALDLVCRLPTMRINTHRPCLATGTPERRRSGRESWGWDLLVPGGHLSGSCLMIRSFDAELKRMKMAQWVCKSSMIQKHAYFQYEYKHSALGVLHNNWNGVMLKQSYISVQSWITKHITMGKSAPEVCTRLVSSDRWPQCGISW